MTETRRKSRFNRWFPMTLSVISLSVVIFLMGFGLYSLTVGSGIPHKQTYYALLLVNVFLFMISVPLNDFFAD